MKVSKIYSNSFRNYSLNNAKHSSTPILPQNVSNNKNISNLFYNDLKITQQPKTIIFMGQMVHIVDGGNHATNMQHFAKAISSNMHILMHDVEVNARDKNTKQLSSLEKQLKELNKRYAFYGEYIAIPALASVPILNINDQFNRIMAEKQAFTPENIKANKSKLLAFLKKLYDSPSLYREYINYMDPSKQGIEHTYGVIAEINKLICKGAKVYIPSGHPHEETLKWMAGEKGLKPELYHYIATGVDVNNCIHEMSEQIKSNNWYSFNLLSLSDANVVGVKGAKGAQDYMFAAYDSCITDGARGVYNFSPVRKDGALVGYSYTDKTTNEYPYSEFPANEEIANLVKFVGEQYTSVTATQNETAKLKEAIKFHRSTDYCPDKLYAIDDIFTQEEIKRNKLNLQGKYIDRSLKLFFDINNNGEVIFPKCDCEGSGKPSVLSMWGSCFSVFNAIKRDIELSQKVKVENSIEEHSKLIQDLKNKAVRYKKELDYKNQEDTLNYAIEKDKAFFIKNPNYYLDFELQYMLGNLHYQYKHFDYASSCYNNAINYLSRYLCGCEKINLKDLKNGYENYISSKKNSAAYDNAIREYNNKSFLTRLFSACPQKPVNYNSYIFFKNDFELHKKVVLIAEMFDNLGNICKKKGENYPYLVCEAAAKDIRNNTERGCKIIEQRSQNIQYIGNLFPEIKENN